MHSCRMDNGVLPLAITLHTYIACDSVTTMYSQCLQTVRDSIAVCIPVKTVTIGPRDPDFVTP